MSLSKKDPSLRVAANDPHLVSLGGGRLSTAVTIHNIPVGDTTIGSSTQCNISLSGPGVRPVHCTIYRSEENQVTLVPEREARILIDGHLVELEVDMKQGAMITLGESYYLRYNNPAEAMQMRTAMGDMLNDLESESSALDYFYESNINPNVRAQEQMLDVNFCKTYNNLKPLDINGWQCPKVFSSDLVTVNMPAKAVLGQKYANFAKNLAENHRKDKYNSTKNPEGLYVNIPMKPHVKALSDSCEFLTKVQNTSTPQRGPGGELNKVSKESLLSQSKDHLDDMLKICSEYSDRQERSGGSLSSSPVVQNRIKTNGSLPRDKKSPFFQDFATMQIQNSLNSSTSSLSASPSKSTGYENVRFVTSSSSSSCHRVEITNSPKSTGYENVKLVPQSPRTKIRTNCLSPKKESSYSSNIFTKEGNNLDKMFKKPQTTYEDLIKNFEEKFQKEIEAIEECTRAQSISTSKTLALSANSTPVAKRTNKNINNLTIDIKSLVSPQNSPKPLKKPTPAPRNLTKFSKSVTEIGSLTCAMMRQPSADRLHREREDLLKRLQTLKMEISLLQQQDNEALIGMDMENALVLGELQSLNDSKLQLEQDYQLLQQKIHRLEAQRNATRVMEENQQAKLKQSIEMKQEQVTKLKEMLQQKPNNECLKEELQNVKESFENDGKSFEDLEFQYLEGESEWQDQKEELYSAEKRLLEQLEETKAAIHNLENQDPNTTTSEQQNTLHKRLVALLNDLQKCELEFKRLEKHLASQQQQQQEQHSRRPQGSTASLAIVSQSLFGSTEMLCPKQSTEDLMSKSFNENLIYNNKIETPSRKSQEHLAITGSFRNSREASIKLLDSIKEIERNRLLLATKQQHSALEQEKRKLEDILMQLGSESKTGPTETNALSKENKENLKQNLKRTNLQESQNTSKLNIKQSQKSQEQQQDLSTTSNNQRPLSESNSETGENLLNTKNVNKRTSVNDLFAENAARSVNSLPDKRTSSALSNETPSQGGDSHVSSEKRKGLAKHQRPLTRYLPIFAPDLDLRRHIESAGHQIALCPHTFLDGYACRGYLHKLGSTFHTWSKRWFVLDRQRQALIYYYDKSERKPRGGAYFSSIDEVYMDHLNASKSSRPHCTFIVKTKKRLYYLQAASDAAARIWIDAIITGAQGNIDY